MRASKQTGDSTRDVRDLDQSSATNAAMPVPVSALAVSGLYRLSSDRKMPFVPRREPAQSTVTTAPLESAEQEYVDPEIIEEQLEALLAGAEIREELRLDVDGQYPQMTASGTITRRLAGRIDWIAHLKSTGRFSWRGQIWQKQGDIQLFPYTQVAVTVSRSMHNHQRRATVMFSGGGMQERVRAFRFHSAYFGEIDFRLDRTQDVASITAIDTDTHPNRPDALPRESLTVQTVFRRAGLRTAQGSEEQRIISGAPEGAAWSDMELHDSMQSYWAAYSRQHSGALWGLVTSRHSDGANVGGVVFEDIGFERQRGLALFSNSFVTQAPAGDAEPAAWAERAQFCATIHEIGRAFDLGYSWDTFLESEGVQSWIRPAASPEARSFMTAPHTAGGGASEFFNEFEFRFSDSELLAMRHAFRCGTQRGQARWFDRYGFDQAQISSGSPLRLELRLNRPSALEFLEPARLELRLTNVSEQLQLLPEDLLSEAGQLTLVLRRRGESARRWLPFAQHYRKPANTVLRTGQSLHRSLFVAADRTGWLVAEPGNYLVHACLHLGQMDVVSNPLQLRVSPPLSRDEEVVAQDFFSDEVGRTLAFDGTHQLSGANTILQEVATRLADRRVATHAKMALLVPALENCKRLDLTGDQPQISIVKADRARAYAGLDVELGTQAVRSIETLGLLDFNRYLERYGTVLEQEGARNLTDGAIETLKLGRQALLKQRASAELLDALDLRIGKLERRTRAA